jgi:methyl-accepting chemotaxis protein
MGLNIELLESSFKLVAPKGDALVTRFYERLFEEVSGGEAAVQEDLDQGAEKEAAGLPGPGDSEPPSSGQAHPVLQDMGARHVGYGAKPAYYDAVGENLLAVSGEVAGPAWTPQVKQAWTDAYGPSRPSCSPERSVHIPHKERRR